MRTWPTTPVPALSVRGPEVQVFDTATGDLHELVPTGPARLYVCGITPYDAAHLGHAMTYVSFDLLSRAWRNAGHAVRYVQNVTDVDDPLLDRAHATGEDWQELAERETEVFRSDMTALRVLPPDEYIGAVESIPLVLDLVERLQSLGAIYQVHEDYYFDVTADPTFGSLSGLSATAMAPIFAERGGDPDRPGKRNAMDCLVWRAERPGEPHWPSPLGSGRPGWHIECTAIAARYLGPQFDVQGGGTDLIFPHHEMCAAEAQAADPDHRFARAYVHVGMVGLDGEKMSKSKGNLVFVSRLRAEGADPMAIRLALLGHHYRTEWEWTDEDLTAANERLGRWRAALAAGGGDAQALQAQVLAALAQDLDAPRALELVDAWADASLAAPQHDPAVQDTVAALLDAALGVALR